MNAKLERRERSHGSILASAARLLRERGISGARVADVMGGAGLTVGGFYAHFASKKELIDAVLERTAVDIRRKLFDGIDQKPAEDRAEVVLKRYLSAAHRDASDGCPFPAVVGEIATTAPEHAEVLAGQVEVFARELEATIGGERIAAREFALGLVALMVGGLSVARALRGTSLSDEVLRACRALGKLALRRGR